MNQELIDLLRGELDDERADALRARLKSEPALARELAELESLFGLLRKGEEVEPSAESRDRVLRTARAAVAPGIWERLAALPGLFRFRFRHSAAFRVAALSLCAHLLVMAVLFQFTLTVRTSTRDLPDIGVVHDLPPYEPSRGFALRLAQRRVPHDAQLRRYGVPGQADAIRAGLADLLAHQRPDGSFGDVAATAKAALALLAEGHSSAQLTREGRALAGAVRVLKAADPATAGGAALAALVEDWTLAFDQLPELERAVHVRTIFAMLPHVGDDAWGREALGLAELAGFPVPAGRDTSVAAALRRGDRPVDGAATRLAATIALARGGAAPDGARAWAAPLFRTALRRLAEAPGAPDAILTLQAPYRL